VVVIYAEIKGDIFLRGAEGESDLVYPLRNLIGLKSNVTDVGGRKSLSGRVFFEEVGRNVGWGR
jgi:hypothetical protein